MVYDLFEITVVSPWKVEKLKRVIMQIAGRYEIITEIATGGMGSWNMARGRVKRGCRPACANCCKNCRSDYQPS